MNLKRLVVFVLCLGLLLSAGVSQAVHYKKKTIVWVQQELKTLGYYHGKISGSLDKETTEAIKAFQKKHGLKADGIPGKKTRYALKKAVLELKTKKKPSTTGVKKAPVKK